MNSLLERFRVRRLASVFTILATLSVGVLVGSVITHGVKGKEVQADSSDATPLKVPNPVTLSNTFSQIAKEVGPAVVNINTETLPKQQSARGRRNPHGRAMPTPNGPDSGDEEGDGSGQDGQNFQDFFNRFFGGGDGEDGMDDGGGMRQSLGSGFIVDPKGYIITNNHVVEKADKIYVKLSTDPDGGDMGRPARVIGTDKDTDLAVIKIDSKEPLPTVKLGNSDAAQVGDWVIAIGSPFSLSQTVTAGIVSAKNRTIQPGAAGQFQHFIQTDAAINPGNSGGPLVNMAGEVVGVNTAIYTQSAGYQGVGFAMPSNTVIATYNDLIGPTHKVTRGSIGISFQPNLPSAVGRVYGFKNGVLINAVQPGQPADKAGLKAGDIITSVDGKKIKDGDELVSEIASRKIGSSVRLGYVRDGKEATASVMIGDRTKVFAPGTSADNSQENAPGSDDAGQAKLGISVRDLPGDMASKTGLHGVQIQSVKPGSFADEINLVSGLVIVQINRQPVANVEQFRNAVNGLKSGSDVVFQIVDPRQPKGGVNYVGGTLP
ncbi:MAG TPA: Do family serine endopeptidase [Acidisarcina sp.]|nr:Do family serine endopeptidase [Acidisarcina sp.]